MLDEEIARLLRIRDAALAALPPVNAEAEARIDELFRKSLSENPKVIKLIRRVPS